MITPNDLTTPRIIALIVDASGQDRTGPLLLDGGSAAATIMRLATPFWQNVDHCCLTATVIQYGRPRQGRVLGIWNAAPIANTACNNTASNRQGRPRADSHGRIEPEPLPSVQEVDCPYIGDGSWNIAKFTNDFR